MLPQVSPPSFPNNPGSAILGRIPLRLPPDPETPAMDAPDSRDGTIKALLIQNGGSAFISKDALAQAMACELEVKADEKGTTLTAKKFANS